MENSTIELPPELEIAKRESFKSDMREKVGAMVRTGKTVVKGHNKRKTHTKYANPHKHIRTSLHAELDCLIKVTNDKFPNLFSTDGVIYVYRQTLDGKTAMARPCEHCLSFLRRSDIHTIVYSTSEFPFWKKEEIK